MPRHHGTILSLDTETTGTDLYHGAKPYLVTVCDERDQVTWWEWSVDPKTREPIVVYEDLEEIAALLRSARRLILQNAKFDYRALTIAFQGNPPGWDWAKVEDTLIAGHLLASNHPHDLTSMAVEYLQLNLAPYEDTLERACKKARNDARRRTGWRIAEKGLPCMPSAGAKLWKYDSWLPRAIAVADGLQRNHPWHQVATRYANADSQATLHLWRRQIELIKRRGLERIYRERLRVLPIAAAMEGWGVTLSEQRLRELYSSYSRESCKAQHGCEQLARRQGYALKLPKSGSNTSLQEYLEHTTKGYPIRRTATGRIGTSKNDLQALLDQLPAPHKTARLLQQLMQKRRRDTALSYMEQYIRFWLDHPNGGCKVLHPNLNPTGTDTLRWSSSNPNEQNISKQEGFNLRYCFGPAPGREWWSLDAKNIELRIPAYEANEREMINLFEREDEPPYYGSYHMLIFSILHPDKFARYGMDCKKKYASTWYQWTKNGNFATQYGAVEQSGTADRAYHVPGAQRKIKERFKGITALNESMIRQANRLGYVATLPDKSVDPNRGYPLLCTRSAYGDILPTVPLNYHVQGTAMWWMCRAMVRCHEYLAELSRRRKRDYRIVMQVHDELVLDFPYKKGQCNLPVVYEVRRLMEQGGQDIGVPTPVGIEYHEYNWSEGTAV